MYEIQADGDLFLGEDISDPGKTAFPIFANAQTYNTEAFSAGDMLFGDNSASKANMFWDKSAGQLKFRGGQATELFIDTDGSLTAGAGDVILNSDGITLNQGNTTTEKIKVVDGSNIIAEIFGFVDVGVSGQLIMVGRGRGDAPTATPEGYVSLVAITHDGTAHAGAASASLDLSTSNDRATISAGETRILGDLEVTGAAVFNELSQSNDFRIEGNNTVNLFFVDASRDSIGINTSNPDTNTILDFGGSLPIKIPRATTTQRDSISASVGMLIYSTTTGRFQGYASAGGNAWKNLH